MGIRRMTGAAATSFDSLVPWEVGPNNGGDLAGYASLKVTATGIGAAGCRPRQWVRRLCASPATGACVWFHVHDQMV